MPYDYIRDGAAIYRQSFATIRAEADLSRFDAGEAEVAVRMIHACGLVDAVHAFAFAPGAVAQAAAALRQGAPILCDAEMVARGITRARLPADNRVICHLHHPDVTALAGQLGTTRSAAALELWRADMGGAIIAIGNAPTSLFHLLEMLENGAPRPAAVIGMPVGFVGAMESKQALVEFAPSVPWLTVHGRLGGSAMTAAAINALAGLSA